MVAEAFEYFMTDRMQDYDETFSERLDMFEAAMVVVPSGSIADEYLLLSRTTTMWGRLRQIYFEVDNLPPD